MPQRVDGGLSTIGECVVADTAWNAPPRRRSHLCTWATSGALAPSGRWLLREACSSGGGLRSQAARRRPGGVRAVRRDPPKTGPRAAAGNAEHRPRREAPPARRSSWCAWTRSDGSRPAPCRASSTTVRHPAPGSPTAGNSSAAGRRRPGPRPTFAFTVGRSAMGVVAAGVMVALLLGAPSGSERQAFRGVGWSLTALADRARALPLYLTRGLLAAATGSGPRRRLALVGLPWTPAWPLRSAGMDGPRRAAGGHGVSSGIPVPARGPNLRGRMGGGRIFFSAFSQGLSRGASQW
jgi:hypothetical protein